MGAKRKAKARELLEKRDLEGIIGWTEETRSALSTLFSLTFEKDERIRWRAIEATGKAATVVAKQNEERVRDFLRRLLWLMNDESGGLGWHAPETIGEVVFNLPALASEYVVILASFLRAEPFERGTHFALARTGSLAPEAIRASTGVLQVSLTDNDPAIRALAWHALRIAQSEITSELDAVLKEDTETFSLYDFTKGNVRTVSVKTYLRETG